MNIKTDYTFYKVDRKLAIIAALPQLLFGLLVAGIAIFLLAHGSPRPLELLNIARASIWHNSAITVGAISFLLLVYAAILAIQNRLAIWSYTWIGAILVGYFVCLFLVAEDQGFLISKAIDIMLLAQSFLSCLIIFCYVALKGWRHTGLICIGFAGTFGLSLLFFQVFTPFLTYLYLASVLIGLMLSILVYIFLRSHSDIVRIILIFILASLDVGISWTIEKNINEFWNIVVFIIGFLLVGTVCGIPGQFIRRKFGLLNSK